MSIKNDFFLRIVCGEVVECLLVWLMWQVGCILLQYCVICNWFFGFKELVEILEFVVEVIIQLVDELNVDVVIIFFDILVIFEVMGLIYEMVEKCGLFFLEVIKSEVDV